MKAMRQLVRGMQSAAAAQNWHCVTCDSGIYNEALS